VRKGRNLFQGSTVGFPVIRLIVCPTQLSVVQQPLNRLQAKAGNVSRRW